MPESEYPIREVVELPGDSSVTEIMWPDVRDAGYLVGVVSSQDDDHAAGVHTLHAGKHCVVMLEADDAIAMALRLLELAVDPDDRVTTRQKLAGLIDQAWTDSSAAADEILDHFEVIRRAED